MKVIQQFGGDLVPEAVIGPVFPVYTIDAVLGVTCERHTIRSAPEAELWGIHVGEEGRGRWRSTILVDRPEVEGDRRVLRYARIAETRSGAPKLVASPAPSGPAGYCIVYLPLSFGFRGGNNYTGDALAELPSGGYEFATSPWIPLAIGKVADGIAGRMGGGRQMVALLPRGVVGRTAMTGRRAPDPEYYYFDGTRLLCRTWQERVTLAEVDGDAFPLSPTMST